jgi:hypothetical protein
MTDLGKKLEQIVDILQKDVVEGIEVFERHYNV